MSDRCRWLLDKTTSVYVISNVSISKSTQGTTRYHLKHRSLRPATQSNREEALPLRFSSYSIQTTRLERREWEERGRVLWEATSLVSLKTWARQQAASNTTAVSISRDSGLMRDPNHHSLTSRTMLAERDNRQWAVWREEEQAQMCLRGSKTY
jgi:hypothetical protein